MFRRKSKSTMVELVEELEKLPQTDEIKFMIQEAKAGEYHDYKNQKYICGKLESYTRLSKLGYQELADRIKSGEFDEEADKEDKANLRKIALESGFNEKQAEKLFGL